nr:unnamed protein product [Digitaria exilis]
MGEGDASAGGSGAGGDPQRLKRIAAAAYDYENDARWAGYWSNVLVPPHLASRPDVVDHFKRKFYQRYIDPALVVEPMSSMTSTQSSRPAARSSATPSSENTRAHDSGSNTRSTGASQQPSAERSANSLRLDGRTMHFSVNAWVWNDYLLTSRRNIIQTFMYFHLLKMMYHAPVTSGYHQSVWARIGRAVNPYIYRYAPFLNTPISAIQRWWLR